MALFVGTERALTLGLLGLGLALSTACGGGDPCDTAVDATCGSDTGSETDSDTATQGPAPFVPAWFFAEGQFGYDATLDKAVPYTFDEGTGAQAVNPAVAITLAEEAYTTTYNDVFTCVVLVEYAGNLDMAAWTTPASAIFGVSFPADSAVQSNCDAERFDQLVWGPDPVAAVSSWTWGIGVKDMSTTVRADLKAAIDAATDVDWTTDYEPYVVGGGFYLNGLDGSEDFPGGFAETAFTSGYAVDGSFAIVMDGANPVRLLANDIVSGTMPSGAYMTQSMYLLSGAESLAGQ